MARSLALPELEAPIARVEARVDAAIEGLRPYGRSALWSEAIAATLALSRATTHLLRAQLVLLGSLAAGGAGEGAEIERFAAGVELLHLFLLVHDDVMDNATLRRGRPTLRVALAAADPGAGGARGARSGHRRRQPAQRAGDALPHPQPGRRGRRDGGGGAAAGGLLPGGRRAVPRSARPARPRRRRGGAAPRAVDKAAYHAFVAPFAAGLLLARPESNLEPAIAWGCHLGLAYQGADDLADLAGSPVTTGKDGLRDLLEGRTSLPLLFLRRRAAPGDREFLDGLAARHAMEIGERVLVDGLVRTYRVVEACADWVRVEVAAAAHAREAAGFARAASEGMAAIERGLVAYLDAVAASVRSRDGADDA